MPQIVNTNILSINAQRQLNKTQDMQTTAIQRLSSGLRINSAKDDAAGLAISTRFETQVRGLNQAVRNANDGISLAQTAEGSMNEMTNILQRMRELAVQSANGTNSAQDRASIQAEVDQLYDELGRIADNTEFNGVKLLDGSSKENIFQIGANANQNISFSLDSVTTTALNLNGFSKLSDLNGGRVASGNSDIQAGAITINGQALGSLNADTSRNQELTDTDGLVAFINSSTSITGVTADAYNSVKGGSGVSGVTDGNLTINDNTVGASGNMQELVSNINRDVAGVSASMNATGGLVLSNDTGADIVIGTGNSQANLSAAGLTAGEFFGFISLSSTDGEPVEIGYDEANGGSASLLRELGFNTSSGSGEVTSGDVSGDYISTGDGVQINGVDIGEVRIGTSDTVTAANIASAINNISEKTGVTADANTQVEYQVTVSVFSANATAISINGVVIGSAAGTVTNSLNGVISAINNADIQGVVASANADGELVLTSEDGLNIDVDIEAAAADGALLTTTGGSLVSTGTYTTRGSITLEGKNGKDVIITSNQDTQSEQTAALAKLGLAAQGGSSAAIGLKLDVSTAANANNAIERIDEALQKISSSRADLGAIQNRFESTISNLENVSQNLQAANSRIRDADFAQETSALTKSQILQQAGISMLAQANASQQNVLSLLG